MSRIRSRTNKNFSKIPHLDPLSIPGSLEPSIRLNDRLFLDLPDEYDNNYNHEIETDVCDDLIPIIGEENFLSPIYFVIMVLVIIGIIINIHLLYSLSGNDRYGAPIDDNRRNMALTTLIGLNIFLMIIFMGSIYMMRKNGMNNHGVSIIVILIVSFFIMFITGTIVGEYMNVGHLWSPIK